MLFFTPPVNFENKNRREKYPHISEVFCAGQKECEDLLKEDGGGHLFSSNKFVNFVHCPVCSNEKAKSLLVKWGGHYVQCTLCTHVYVRNMFKKEVLESFYARSYVESMQRKIQRNDDDINYYHAMYKKYFDLCVASNQNLSILDVGAGAGGFVNYVIENTTFSISAIELCEETKGYLESLIGKRGIFWHGKSIGHL